MQFQPYWTFKGSIILHVSALSRKLKDERMREKTTHQETWGIFLTSCWITVFLVLRPGTGSVQLFKSTHRVKMWEIWHWFLDYSSTLHLVFAHMDVSHLHPIPQSLSIKKLKLSLCQRSRVILCKSLIIQMNPISAWYRRYWSSWDQPKLGPSFLILYNNKNCNETNEIFCIPFSSPCPTANQLFSI